VLFRSRGQADTRAYMKRQFTWFRNQAPEFAWVAPEAAHARISAELASLPAG
jgi:tRNA dimethylallyltransferase